MGRLTEVLHFALSPDPRRPNGALTQGYLTKRQARFRLQRQVNSFLSDPWGSAPSDVEMLIANFCGVLRPIVRSRHSFLTPPERLGILFDLRDFLVQRQQEVSHSQIPNAERSVPLRVLERELGRTVLRLWVSSILRRAS